MSTERESWIMAAIDLLADWPSNGRPDQMVGLDRTVRFAESLGWIEQAEVMSQCKTCGHARPGYSYHRITAAGQAALELFRLCERGVEALAERGELK